MAVSGDVKITQDGGANIKLHPYLITLIRWCVSCLWSTASEILHRLAFASLPSITSSKQSLKLNAKYRQAGTDHLHPEPKVECVVLHRPETPTMDVIFVHGLYGSLGNTWRQGDWRTKYKLDPKKVSLRNHANNICNCHAKQEQQYKTNYTYETNINETISFKQINGCFDKILPHENILITEKFYNNTLLDINVNSYETQAEFVSELFKNDNNTCDINIDTFKCNLNDDDDVNKCNCIDNNENCKCKIDEQYKLNECKCIVNDDFKLDKCKIGCGCVCDECYSDCWPKDWIKEDFPGARIISINYTSDPYLWRPLWIKSNKRLRLHERAEQMIEQLLDLGVGKIPIIWVGHSKGGLFIKQIYCEAFDAFNKINKNTIDSKDKDQINVLNEIDNDKNKKVNPTEKTSELSRESDDGYNTLVKSLDKLDEIHFCTDIANIKTYDNTYNAMTKSKNEIQNFDKNFNFLKYTEDKNTEICGCNEKDVVREEKEDKHDLHTIHISIQKSRETTAIKKKEKGNDIYEESSNDEEDFQVLQTRSSLWQQSAGFMFYSVPHRGSPLADIKTPITTRSIELLEISKDCQLVLDLQDRWLTATSTSPPVVRSLVETCRTLMSVLWLRIVSVDSADAGVGSLHGVSVDHREICKPSSRNCLLYTELTELIQNALTKCDCRTKVKRT